MFDRTTLVQGSFKVLSSTSMPVRTTAGFAFGNALADVPLAVGGVMVSVLRGWVKLRHDAQAPTGDSVTGSGHLYTPTAAPVLLTLRPEQLRETRALTSPDFVGWVTFLAY